jgi:acetyl esterase/lipase
MTEHFPHGLPGLTPPPLDPELAPVMAGGGAPMSQIGIQAGRDLAPLFDDATLTRDGRFDIGHRTIPGFDGEPDVTVATCLPAGRGDEPVPGLYHIHGGGMVTGNRTSGLLELGLPLAERFGMAVVSVEYRLAPEHPHPAPAHDCYAGLVWMAEHAGELGIDPARIVVEGQSAGGGLAAATVLMARDLGGPSVLGQMLLCPMLDDRNDTASAWQMTGFWWDRVENALGWGALLGDARGADTVSPYAAPSRATDLAGLPPTFIDAGSAETFRDEDIAYAEALWRAGGQCELHVWPGGFHGFSAIAPGAAISQAAIAAQNAWLERLLANSTHN